ncbi:MAG: outer membrane protein assembly factor BamD [Candidatus Acidiferrales bacterium]
MKIVLEKIRFVVIAALVLSLFGSVCLGVGKKKKKKGAGDDLSKSAEPDKVLYDRAVEDYKRGRYTEERLSLQTLINTYPDSEYLAKAKLAIADSYYKEGGTSSLTQSVAEYSDFITFFPFLEEAAYAQLQVAMAHYRMMEKPDRDRTEAEAAEDALQTFLLKYPSSPLIPKAEQHLREVQEILAEGDYRIGHFYFIKGSYRASAARLLEVTGRYPLYSQSDKALWMLGEIYEKSEKREVADKFYAQIVREYPTSSLIGDAKKKLTAAGVPIPQPDPQAVARLQREKEYAHERPGVVHRSLGMIKTGPDVSAASHSGKPNLTPPAESISPGEVLKPGGAATATVIATASTGNAASSSAAVETVPAGSSAGSTSELTQASGDSSGSDTGAPPVGEASEGVPAAVTGSSATVAPAPAASPDAPAASGSTAAPTDSSKSGASTAQGTSGDASSGSPAASTSAAAGDQANGDKADTKKESPSKKKKGLRKILPW